MEQQKALIIEYSYAGMRKAFFNPNNVDKIARFKKNYGHKIIREYEGFAEKGVNYLN